MRPFYTKSRLNIDTTLVQTSPGVLPMLYNFDRQQKYGAALLRQKYFLSVPNRVFDTTPADSTTVLDKLPPSLLAIEIPKVWVLDIQAGEGEQVMLAPHVDGVRQTAVNIYNCTNGERTCFYQYAGGGQIEECDSFVACDGDIYILDVTKPHAVELRFGKPRRVLTISFITTSYEQVVAEFEKSGLVI